jgi:hypothetical protein
MAVARHGDVVFVVEPAHAPDRLALVLLRVVGDDNADLPRVVRADRGRERLPFALDPVDSLFVREEERPVEAVLLLGEEVRAEALVVLGALDRR